MVNIKKIKPMKQVSSMSELMGAIALKKPFSIERNGKKYNFDTVRVLDSKLSELLALINYGLLFYVDKRENHNLDE